MTWVGVTVWRVGAGLRCVPRAEGRYVVAPAGDGSGSWRVWLAERAGDGRPALVDSHVSLEVPGPGAPLPEAAERADVLLARQGVAASETAASETAASETAWLGAVLARCPGCLVALAPDASSGGCVAGARDGRRVVAAPVAGARRLTGVERAGLASFLHGQLVLGRPWPTDGGSGSVIHSVQGADAAAPLWLRVRALS